MQMTDVPGLNIPHLREAALIIQNPQYPMRLCCDEVKAGLVVVECDVLPWDLLSAVLLLHVEQIKHNATLFFSSINFSSAILHVGFYH